jgi:hypothetical protein
MASTGDWYRVKKVFDAAPNPDSWDVSTANVAAAPRRVHGSWLLILLAIVLAGCGSPGSNQSQVTSPVLTTTETSQRGPRTEPTGLETPQPPATDVGLTIPLGGLPVGGNEEEFTADATTKCVGLSLTNVPPIPAGVSIAVTQVHLSSDPQGAFTLSDSALCERPCQSYTFTSVSGGCGVEVTWHPQGDSHGSVGLDGKASCGKADEKACQAWSAEVKNGARQDVQLVAFGETGTTTTTTSTTTIQTSTPTTTATQRSTSTASTGG